MAIAAKPKGPASDAIMTADKMKPLLVLSKKEPVQAAIGLTADGDGLILLDKRAKPRTVLSMLRADAARANLHLNAASLRFGRAEVDPDYDPAMVRFFVNKETPGVMRVRLVEVVKHVPYQKVEINVDPSLEEEPEEGAEQHETATTTSSAPPPPPPPPPAPPHALDVAVTLDHELAALAHRIAAVTDQSLKARLAQLANGANAAIKAHELSTAARTLLELRTALARSARATPADTVDTSHLLHDLALLAHRIPEVSGADGTLRGSFAGLANEANAAIKANDLVVAADAIDRLREALDAAAARLAEPMTADPGAIWRDAKDSIDAGLNRLAAELRTYDDPDLERIADYGLFGIGTKQNVALNAALFEYGRAPANQRPAAAEKLRVAVDNYRALLQSEPMIDLIDQNPIVPLTLRTTITGALSRIAGAIAA